MHLTRSILYTFRMLLPQCRIFLMVCWCSYGKPCRIAQFCECGVWTLHLLSHLDSNIGRCSSPLTKMGNSPGGQACSIHNEKWINDWSCTLTVLADFVTISTIATSDTSQSSPICIAHVLNNRRNRHPNSMMHLKVGWPLSNEVHLTTGVYGIWNTFLANFLTNILTLIKSQGVHYNCNHWAKHRFVVGIPLDNVVPGTSMHTSVMPKGMFPM